MTKQSHLHSKRAANRYELIRDSSATVAGSTCSLGASSGAAETGTSTSNRGRRQSWRAPDGARGIRVRLKRLVTGASLGPHRRRMKELAGETKVSSGDGVLFEAVREDNGKASRTVVRVLNRGGAEEPPAGQGGAGASSGAGELLDFFVESVMLLSTLCRERHVRNIQLVRSLKGTSFEVRATGLILSDWCRGVSGAASNSVKCAQRISS